MWTCPASIKRWFFAGVRVISKFFSGYEQTRMTINWVIDNLLKAVLNAADPISLAARLVFARNLEGIYGGVVDTTKFALVALGLFYIVKIEQKVLILTTAYDFCIPDKAHQSADFRPRGCVARVWLHWAQIAEKANSVREPTNRACYTGGFYCA